MRLDELFLWYLGDPATPRYVGALRLVAAGKGAKSLVSIGRAAIDPKRPVSHSKVLLTGMLRSCRWRPHPTGQLLPFNPQAKSSLDRLLCFGYRP